MTDVGIYIEPIAPWARERASAINRGRNLMTMPGSRDVDTGTLVLPIDPSRPRGRVYQPDLHLPGPIGGEASVRWVPMFVALGLAGFGGLVLAGAAAVAA